MSWLFVSYADSIPGDDCLDHFSDHGDRVRSKPLGDTFGSIIGEHHNEERMVDHFLKQLPGSADPHRGNVVRLTHRTLAGQ
jgi:hypothetical protein